MIKKSKKPDVELIWVGKENCIDEVHSPTNYILEACPKESVDFDTTDHMYIEGDNLDVLKILQETHFGKVKMIYIDPPYNTGKKFIYNDRFGSHSAWLNMMYPRLYLARNLLREDGVIFISIDDNEQDNLKKLCNEVFGEENFIAQFIWKNRTTPNDVKSNFAPDHEYLLVYAKIGEILQFKGVEKDLSNYRNTDNDPKGLWIADNPSAASGNYTFEIKNPYTGDVYTPPAGRYWAFSEQRVSEWSESGKLVFPKEKGVNFLLKKYLSDLKSEKKPLSSIIDGILTSNGTKELKALYDEGSPFKYPKPSKLIKLLIEQVCEDNDIVMDFFSGSGTTAHAVMKLNAEDGSNRKCISVQIPEPTDKNSEAYKAGYKSISEIGKERIRRAAKKIKEENPGYKGDLGFKVFKLKEKK